jgi:hypothetical protein
VGLRAKVLDSEKIEGMPIDELEIHRGRPRRFGKREQPPPQGDRAAEIRAMDRSGLSDTEWLALFREYAVTTGLMAARQSQADNRRDRAST